MIFRAEQVFRRTQKFEGFRSRAYKDSLGVWTIGYGATMWYGSKVTSTTAPVSRLRASRKLRGDIFQAVMDCQKLYGHRFDELSDVEQEILIHMCFQLGLTKLRRFERMNIAIMIDSLKGWEEEMQDSLWWKQTPRAATALYNALVEGEWTGIWAMT